MLDPWIWMCQGLSIFSSSAWRAMSTQMTWRGCLVRCSSRPIMMIEFDPRWDPQNHNKWVIKTIKHVVVYDIVLWLSVQSTVIPILNAAQLIFTLIIIKLIYKDKDVSPLCSIIIWQPQTSGSEDNATTFLHEPRAFASRLCGTCFGSWYRRTYFRPAQCINRQQRTNRLGKK